MNLFIYRHKIERLILLLAILVSCTIINSCENVPDLTQSNSLILEGYLYANEPIEHIKLTKIVSFDSEESEKSPVNDADVQLIHDDKYYLLVKAEGDSGFYYYPDNDLEIKEGETYSIIAEAEGITISASTTVPEAPINLMASNYSIQLPQISSQRELAEAREYYYNTVDITWTNENSEYFYLIIQNVESNPESINISNRFSWSYSFITEPTSQDSYTMESFFQIQQFGMHEITLYKVNQEYVDLYETLKTDSRSFTGAISNVKNGLGIFTALTGSKIYVNVEKAE